MASGLSQVKEAFRRSLAEDDQHGASLCVYVGGRAVIDLWGGEVGTDVRRPFAADSLLPLFSATKGVTAAVALLLVQDAVLSLDAPISTIWPELTHGEKQGLTLRHVLSHQAGLPSIDECLTLDEVLLWAPVVRALEAQDPAWTPGTAHGYHPLTFGWLVGELVRRTAGTGIGQVLDDRIARPLRAEVWIGLPASMHAAVSQPSPPPAPAPDELARLVAEFGPATPRGRALSLGGALPASAYGSSDVLSAEIPAANGVASARGLARFYASLIGPVEGGPDAGLFTPETLAEASTSCVDGPDATLSSPDRPVDSSFSAGFMLPAPGSTSWGSAGAFGHPGAGGALGFADPQRDLAFAYLPTRMSAPGRAFHGDARAVELSRTLYNELDNLRLQMHSLTRD